MTEFPSEIFGISCLLISISFTYLVYRLSKSELLKKVEIKEPETSLSVIELLPSMKGKQCELTFQTPSTLFGYEMSGRGVLLDVDEEWICLSTQSRKGEVQRVCRISQVKDIREIVS